MKLIKLTAIMAILSASAALIAGCGGGMGAAIIISKSGASDNPIIPMPQGHPNRIVYASFPSDQGTIMSMDESGGNKITLTSKPDEDARSFFFTTPAVSQNGLQIYYASDWYSATTDLMTSKIDGLLPGPVVRDNGLNLENPRVSWDGTKIAFAGYEEREVTAVIHPSRAFVYKSANVQTPEQNANIGLTGGGEWLYSQSNTQGICPKSCSQCESYEFTQVIFFANGFGSPRTTDPTGSTYCIALDDVNRVSVNFTAHDYSPPAAGSITFTWEWLQNPHPETFGPITLQGALSGEFRIGMGYNFINTFNFKKYDLFTADIDGSNVVQHTDDDDPARFPCFSPVASDFLYYTQGVLDTAYMEYDFPESSAIYKLDLNTGAKTLVFAGAMDRHCGVSPSGKQIVFSRYDFDNERYDIYLHNLETGATTLLVDTGGNDLYPVFSPSGVYVAFQSDLTIDDDIFTIKVDGTNLKNVTNNLVDDRMPAWAP
ncbi:MAG TPA: hypothetical protein PKH33_12000 [bacterium]|nr:hypothetical protein [bacterium]